MQTQRCERFEFESDKEIIVKRVDGTTTTAANRFSFATVHGLIAEVVPDSWQAAFVAGESFGFQYSRESDVFTVEVRHNAGALAVTIHRTNGCPGAPGAQVAERIVASVPGPIAKLKDASASNALAPSGAATCFVPVVVSVPPEPQTPECATALPVPAGACPSVAGAAPAESNSKPGTAPGLRSSPGFSRPTPRGLEWPEADCKLFSAGVGMAMGLGTSLLACVLARKGGILGHMFNLSSPSSAIPVAISCMFFWGLVLCVLRWIQVYGLEGVSRLGLLSEATQVLKTAGPAGLARQLDEADCHASPLLRRLQAIVQQWQVRPDLQDVDFVLQQHVVNDAEAVHRGYSLVRTFVWALPVLGLIGTVIGISWAVGDFTAIVEKNSADLVAIKQGLMLVTKGLSFAFLITLDGLLTSLVLMLMATFLQTREERLYATVQQALSDVFLPVLQKVAPAFTAPSLAGEAERLREPLFKVSTEVISQVGEACNQLLSRMEARQDEHRLETSRWQETLRQEAEAGAKCLTQATLGLGDSLKVVNTDLVSHFAAVRNAMERESERLEGLTQAQVKAAAQLHAEMREATAEQTGAVRNATSTLAMVMAATNTALERQVALQEAMRQLSDSKLAESFTGFSNAIAAQSREMRGATDAMQGIAGVSREILAAQQTLQAAINQLREVGLTKTLAELRAALAGLGPVLAGFRGPFVLQAVPAHIKGNGHRDGSPISVTDVIALR